MTLSQTSGDRVKLSVRQRLQLAGEVIRQTGRTLTGLALEACGAAAIVVGTAQFSVRVAWIVGGMMAITLAFVMGDS